MLLVGFDDTDMPDSPGTNQLARAVSRELAGDWQCVRIVRHQLLDDQRVPCTSKNGSASMALQPRGDPPIDRLAEICRRIMREWFVEGSDPGLCIAESVPHAIVEFGLSCQSAVMTQETAREVARLCGVNLEGLGGTNGGIIGALAAVGLAETGNDGRIVQLGERQNDLGGIQTAAALQECGVELRHASGSAPVMPGRIDVGKKLRPNLREGRAVLFVRPHPEPESGAAYQAVRLP